MSSDESGTHADAAYWLAGLADVLALVADEHSNAADDIDELRRIIRRLGVDPYASEGYGAAGDCMTEILFLLNVGENKPLTERVLSGQDKR